MQGLTAAVVEMSSGRQEMEAIMTEVAEIVETNSTAAEQLTGSSEQVLEAMAEVSAVSEQNSAAAEQVSASAQEVSIQVEETASSAESLTDMAQALQQVVAQFRLDVRASKHEETNNGVTGYIGFSSGTNGYNSADKDEQDVALYELPVSA
jgi:methyl-accepting chemotaxis protein